MTTADSPQQTIDPQRLQRELRLNQAIDQRLDRLVILATCAALLLEHNGSMEIGQVRNVLNVAVETSSIEVVVNFIRYQIARNNYAWGKGFGNRVIENLRGPVKLLVDPIYNELSVPQDTKQEDVDLIRNDIYARLARLYLGYLHRAFYSYKRLNNKDEREESLKQLKQIVAASGCLPEQGQPAQGERR